MDISSPQCLRFAIGNPRAAGHDSLLGMTRDCVVTIEGWALPAARDPDAIDMACSQAGRRTPTLEAQFGVLKLLGCVHVHRRCVVDSKNFLEPCGRASFINMPAVSMYEDVAQQAWWDAQ